MYQIVEAALGVIMLILGVIMFFAPRICTKKELRDDPTAVDQIKKSGAIMSVIGVVVVILAFI